MENLSIKSHELTKTIKENKKTKTMNLVIAYGIQLIHIKTNNIRFLHKYIVI